LWVCERVRGRNSKGERERETEREREREGERGSGRRSRMTKGSSCPVAIKASKVK